MLARTPKRKLHETLTVTKTVSLPLDLLNRVSDESEIMGKSFSDCTSTLLRLGLSLRADQRRRDNEDDTQSTKSGNKGEILD